MDRRLSDSEKALEGLRAALVELEAAGREYRSISLPKSKTHIKIVATRPSSSGSNPAVADKGHTWWVRILRMARSAWQMFLHRD